MRRLCGAGFLLLCAVVGLGAPYQDIVASQTKASPSSGREETIENVHKREMQTNSTGNIPDMLSRSSGDVHIECIAGTDQKVSLPAKGELETLACDSDLVIRGKPDTGSAHLTGDGNFVYTDWTFVVDEVFLDNPQQSVAPGNTIIIARAGGKLNIQGRVVSATCSPFVDGEFTHGKEYVLFLRFLPDSGTYKLGGPNGFEFSGNEVSGLGKSLREPKWAHYDRSALLILIKEATGSAASSCHRSGGR